MPPNRFRIPGATLGLVGILLLPPAAVSQAATATTLMAVSATVLSACTVVALPLIFGNYQGSQLDATTTLTVLCTNGTSFNIGLDLGSNASGGSRRMLGPLSAQYLTYSLARDAAYTQPWGNTVGTDTYQGTSTGILSTVQVNGRISQGQSPSPGIYLDTVTVTLTY